MRQLAGLVDTRVLGLARPSRVVTAMVLEDGLTLARERDEGRAFASEHVCPELDESLGAEVLELAMPPVTGRGGRDVAGIGDPERPDGREDLDLGVPESMRAVALRGDGNQGQRHRHDSWWIRWPH